MAELWMPDVEQVRTEAKGHYPGVFTPRAVMSHIMQGYQSTMIRWAEERPYATAKSAHFTIGRAGRIVQHVAINEAAWTAGRLVEPVWKLLSYDTSPNMQFIGIEHEGFSVPPSGYGYDYVYDVATPWPPEMVDATIRVHEWVMRELGLVPNHNTVIGHRATDTISRANDPGSAWPQDEIVGALVDSLTDHGPIATLSVEELLAMAADTLGIGRSGPVIKQVPERRDGDFDVIEVAVQRRGLAQ